MGTTPTEKDEDAGVKEYCFCGEPENEEMVECEDANCKHKWFHYKCVGITDPSTLPKEWFCPDCRMKRGE